jgi:short subunit fatty acids transporter
MRGADFARLLIRATKRLAGILLQLKLGASIAD